LYRANTGIDTFFTKIIKDLLAGHITIRFGQKLNDLPLACNMGVGITHGLSIGCVSWVYFAKNFSKRIPRYMIGATDGVALVSCLSDLVA